MRVMICLDDNGGMQFNGRRQSRDRAVVADMLATATGNLRMTAATATLFADAAERVLVTDTPLAGAGADDTCVVEAPPLAGAPIDKLIVYRWNRVYPADRHLDISLENWTLESAHEFAGYSHEKITKEVWKPCP